MVSTKNGKNWPCSRISVDSTFLKDRPVPCHHNCIRKSSGEKGPTVRWSLV